MNKNLRLLSVLAAASLCGPGLMACADEDESDAAASINGPDRGVLGLKILLPSDNGMETLTYEVSRLGERVLTGDAVVQGQTAVGLKIRGLFVGKEYSISVLGTSSVSPMVCRGANESWDILPGRVSTVEVALTCANE